MFTWGSVCLVVVGLAALYGLHTGVIRNPWRVVASQPIAGPSDASSAAGGRA
jgi:hypothetical protein